MEDVFNNPFGLFIPSKARSIISKKRTITVIMRINEKSIILLGYWKVL